MSKRQFEPDSDTEAQSVSPPGHPQDAEQKGSIEKGYGSCENCGQITETYCCSNPGCSKMICMKTETMGGCFDGRRPRWPLLCNHCSRRASRVLTGARASATAPRGLPRADLQPLLIIALTPANDKQAEDPQVENIDTMCRLHYEDHPQIHQLYSFVRIETSPKADSRKSTEITQFLQSIQNARILVIINMHSQEDDGSIQYISRTSRDSPMSDTVSNVLERFLGKQAYGKITDQTGEKGLLLLSCGAVLVRDRSREDLIEKLLKPRVFRFVVGFPTAKLIPRHVQLECQNFVSACFLWKMTGFSEALDLQPTRAQHSRNWAFSSTISNTHTGTVLMETLMEGDIISTEFRMGIPTLLPYGLPIMDCPFCRDSFGVKITRAAPKKVDLCCRCGARAKNVRKPSVVSEVAHGSIGLGHYSYSFPLECSEKVKWELRGAARMQGWSSSSRCFRDSYIA